MARILIIDDEPNLLVALQLGVGRLGHSAHTAGTCEDGLAVLRAHRIDLIITDLVLPGEDGASAVGSVRRAAPSAPVIAMSSDPVLLGEAMRRGAVLTLEKPFTLEAFERAIEGVLGRPSGVERRRDQRRRRLRRQVQRRRDPSGVVEDRRARDRRRPFRAFAAR